jgi:hypothetical protein
MFLHASIKPHPARFKIQAESSPPQACLLALQVWMKGLPGKGLEKGPEAAGNVSLRFPSPWVLSHRQYRQT